MKKEQLRSSMDKEQRHDPKTPVKEEDYFVTVGSSMNAEEMDRDEIATVTVAAFTYPDFFDDDNSMNRYLW